MGIDKIDYSNWKNQKLFNLAKQADTNGTKGLQGEEISAFMRSAVKNNINKAEVYELMGINISRASASGFNSVARSDDPYFDKAVDYYNDNMSYMQRSSVTTKTYENLQTRLYNMEKAIDNAYIDCEAYSDIMIVPRWHYRFYPYFEDKLINFNVDEVRDRTTKDMDSLNELKDKVEYIIEEANGETEHTIPEKTDYNVDNLAKKYLGMSYQEFKEKYSEELEFCKTVTYADLTSMTETQRYVYGKAKAYVKEMLQITINEAHTTNWNTGERKLEETLKASGDMYTISDFEDEGIDEKGLAEIKSGIMFKAFEQALIDKYNELNPTSIDEVNVDTKPQKPVKRLVNGEILIFNPDGSVYDLKGNKIK